MKILVYSQHFWPESFRINDVAQSLHAAGHQVTVLTGQPNYPGGTVFPGYRAASTGVEHFGEIEVHRVPLIPRGPGTPLRLIVNFLCFAPSAAIFGAWRLRGRSFDVIFVYGSSPLLQAIGAVVLARIKRCALVTWVQDLWPQSIQATGYVSKRWIIAWCASVVRGIYRRQHMLLVQSEGFIAPVRELSPAGLPIRVHPNPSESLPVQDGPAPTAPALSLPPGFNIVFAGNLGTAQALDAVLDAAEQLRDVPGLRFVLVGSGSRSAWLAEQVEARGLTNVLLPGRFAPQEMPAILAQAQALLVSLLDDPTMSLTVPSKLQSYLAAGKPILAALGGAGARVVAEAGAGLACAAADAAALARAARRLHALPESERQRMGEAGRQYHDTHFAPEVLTPRLMTHLQDAVNLARQARGARRRQE